eukprot:scaffold22740_cov139-Cylindrotheca_fusiformis.AAC.13
MQYGEIWFGVNYAWYQCKDFHWPTSIRSTIAYTVDVQTILTYDTVLDQQHIEADEQWTINQELLKWNPM